MSWTYTHSGPRSADESNERLLVARDSFLEAQRLVEAARADLLAAHAETNRVWASARA